MLKVHFWKHTKVSWSCKEKCWNYRAIAETIPQAGRSWCYSFDSSAAQKTQWDSAAECRVVPGARARGRNNKRSVAPSVWQVESKTEVRKTGGKFGDLFGRTGYIFPFSSFPLILQKQSPQMAKFRYKGIGIRNKNKFTHYGPRNAVLCQSEPKLCDLTC